MICRNGPRLRRPPSPTSPGRHHRSRPRTLAGALTLPKSAKRGPCVLVPGAGAVDRDDTSALHKPFLVIADYLARRGIAALRLDSRGVGGSTGNYRQSGGEDLARDLRAAVGFLRSTG